MQLDLFAELRDVQRHALLSLRQRCLEVDFTDCDAVFGLQSDLQAIRNLLRDCSALEARHLYPLLGREEHTDDLIDDGRLVHQQIGALCAKLDGICEHVHRNNPVWRSLLTQEGRAFSIRVQIVAHAYLIHLECQHAATTAVSLHRGMGVLPAAQRPLGAALATLRESHHGLLAGYRGGEHHSDAAEGLAQPGAVRELLETGRDETLAIAV